MSTDFDSFFRNRIENLLIYASWVEAVRTRLGLKGVSQIWSGNAAWYLWLQGAPGVYALVFREGDWASWNNRQLFAGQFALKCYPYCEHPSFKGFSAEERRLVRSNCFDSTNTPRLEALAQIPDALFTVGSISLLCDARDPLALLTYQSLNALRLRQRSAKRKAGAGRLIRNVAGWNIGYPLFDCLVGLYAHFSRQPPCFVGLTRRQGFEYIRFTDGKSDCVPSRRSTQTAVSFGFNPPDGPPGRIETIWQTQVEQGEEILLAEHLPVSIGHSTRLDRWDEGRLNPLWWEIAGSDYRSGLALPCGCDQSHCHSEKDGSHES